MVRPGVLLFCAALLIGLGHDQALAAHRSRLARSATTHSAAIRRATTIRVSIPRRIGYTSHTLGRASCACSTLRLTPWSELLVGCLASTE